MDKLKIVNLTRDRLLADRAELAIGLGQRLKGLLGRHSLDKGEGLVIKPCSSIHTFFMRFAIDVVFVDRASRVVKTIEDMQPFRASNPFLSALLTIELPAGTIRRTNTRVGDQLALQPRSL